MRISLLDLRARPRLILSQPAPPPYWRRLTLDAGIMSRLQKRDWLLVLNARGIPWRLARARRREHIYIPAFMHEVARQELAAYSRENRPPPRAARRMRLHSDWPWALLILLPLLWQYGCEAGWWGAWFTAIQDWRSLGRLDGARVAFHHEWWRLATALCLHADAHHLISNLFFGGIFISLLARLCGVGIAWLIAIAGGIAGNYVSVQIHTLSYASIGFSTAIFAALGGIGGLLALKVRARLLLPLGGAMCLLALLGTGGEHTDYGAHVAGFLCGAALGALGASCGRWLPQWLAGGIAIVLLVGAWQLVRTG